MRPLHIRALADRLCTGIADRHGRMRAAGVSTSAMFRSFTIPGYRLKMTGCVRVDPDAWEDDDRWSLTPVPPV